MSQVTNKQLKLFKKTVNEFLDEYNKLDESMEIRLKIKSIDITKYNSDINAHSELFLDRQPQVLNKISLFSKLDLYKVQTSVWEYLNNLYFISEGPGIDPAIIERCKNFSTQVVVPVKIQQTQQPVQGGDQFSSLIGEIAGKVGKSLEGKDLTGINPQMLLAGLMSGNTDSIGGIDFSKILEQTTQTIKSKVDAGELDLESLKTQASGMLGSLNM
jgi:hypothetical protein